MLSEKEASLIVARELNAASIEEIELRFSDYRYLKNLAKASGKDKVQPPKEIKKPIIQPVKPALVISDEERHKRLFQSLMDKPLYKENPKKAIRIWLNQYLLNKSSD